MLTGAHRWVPLGRTAATVGEVTSAEYDALVLPGDVASPDFLRTDDLDAFCAALVEQFSSR